MTVLRKKPYYAFTLKGCVLDRRNKANMSHSVSLDLLYDPRIIIVTTTLSMDGGNESSQRLHHATQGGGLKSHFRYISLHPMASSAFPQPGPFLYRLADLGLGLVAGGGFLEIHLALTSSLSSELIC